MRGFVGALAIVASSVAWLATAGCGSSRLEAGDDDPPRPDAGRDAPTEHEDEDATKVDPAWPPHVPLESQLDVPPYLNLLDASTVVVSWRTTTATTGVVRYGHTPAKGSQVASTSATDLHHVHLTGLVPGAAYYYEVAIDGTSVVRQGVFVTPGRTNWRLMHSGEFHAPSEVDNVAKFAEEIRAFRPHVIIESGDMVDDGNDLDEWRSYLRTSAPWISNTLLLPSHSNHVNGGGGNTNLKELFVLPNNERWYTTRYGQVALINIDSTYSANSDVESAEVPWVRQQAASFHDGVDDPTFVIASWHHPACSSQYYTRQGEREWVHDHLVSAFVDNGGVDLILAAHDKYYERNTIATSPGASIVHVITNIGNVSPQIPGGNHAACKVEKSSRSVQSVLFMTLAGSMLSGVVRDEDGVMIDSFTIAK